MATSIRLFWGAFGHVSVLNVASDFVTHAHSEAHLIVWLEGAAGEMTIGGETVGLGTDARRRHQLIPAAQPCAFADGRPGLFLAFYIDPDWARRRRDLPSVRAAFSDAAIRWNPGCTGQPPTCSTMSDNESVDEIANYEIERFID